MKEKKQDKKGSSKKTLRRELSEWAILITVIAALYLTGLHTEVIGHLQRALLFTGIIQPDTELNEAELRKKAYYDMPLVSLSGKKTSLSEFEGKTIFLNFWATWCPPCIAEMPGIQKLYDEVASDDIVFVMVSLDEDRQTAAGFIRKKAYTFPVFMLGGRKPNIYNSSVVPTTYVLSPSGEIVMEHRGMAKYNTSSFKSFLRDVADQTSENDISETPSE